MVVLWLSVTVGGTLEGGRGAYWCRRVWRSSFSLGGGGNSGGLVWAFSCVGGLDAASLVVDPSTFAAYREAVMIRACWAGLGTSGSLTPEVVGGQAH